MMSSYERSECWDIGHINTPFSIHQVLEAIVDRNSSRGIIQLHQ